MAEASLTAMTEDDYEEFPIISSKYSQAAIGHTLDSLSVFGQVNSQGDYIQYPNEHKRGRIILYRPVINQVLARKDGELLFKILGISKDEGKKIAMFDRALQNGRIVSHNELDTDAEYLIGGELVDQLIDWFDLEKEIQDELFKQVLTIFGSAKAMKAPGTFSTYIAIKQMSSVSDTTYKTGSGDWLLAEDWWLSILSPESVYGTYFKKGITQESNLTAIFTKELFKTGSSRLSYLLALKDNENAKEVLRGMLLRQVVVMPIVYRGKTNGREEPLEKAYGALLAANRALQSDIESEAGFTAINSSYKSLSFAVSDLTFKTQNPRYKVPVAQLQKMAGKKGHVRAKMLGKRQDWSGRAVVTVDPYLPVDTIKIPKSQIFKLLEYYLIGPIKANDLQKFLQHEHDSSFMQALLESGILNDAVLLLGRQPTLHKQSLQGFNIELTDTESIIMNPLVCPGFNMDFDGDTAHLEVPISDKAIVEAKELIHATNNLFYAKTGSCDIAPRQDILYGLYVCTRNSDQECGGDGGTYRSYKAVFDVLTKNKIAVNDMVTVKGEKMQAGHAAIRYCFNVPIDIAYLSSGFSDDKVSKLEGERDKLSEGYDSFNSNEVTLAEEYRQLKAAHDSAITANDIIIAGDKLSQWEQAHAELLPRLRVVEQHVKSLKQANSKLKKLQANKYQINSKNISKYVNVALNQPSGVPDFIRTTNCLVELGFKIARLYPPSVSLIVEGNSVDEYEKEKENLKKSMESYDSYYNIGLMTNDMYSAAYRRNLQKQLASEVSSTIFDKLGPNNGYKMMAESGARGNKSNLQQMFGFKGFISKTNGDNFDVAILNSSSLQLTPLEGFMAAYGGRKGQMEKSLKTSDTGYFSRQLWQTAGHLVITNDDCGTTKGLRIDLQDIAKVTDKEDWQEEFYINAITDRYNLEGNHLYTREDAKTLYKQRASVIIRSPLTCANPCCVKCYGIDPSTHRVAAKGLPIGFIAAQSIGEPVTQLTMKQFQNGGVAGVGDITSDFDRITMYTDMSRLRAKAMRGECPAYDPLAPCDGPVTTIPLPSQREMTIQVGEKNTHINVSTMAELKEYVKRGESISKHVGDICPREMLEYNGVEALQIYLVQKMTNIFKAADAIVPKHFEVIVAAMTQAMIIHTTNDKWRVGQYVDMITMRMTYPGEELVSLGDEIYSMGGNLFFITLVSVKTAPIVAPNALNAFVFEAIGRSLSRAYALGLTDDITKPMVRMFLGLAPKLGTAYPNFIKDRKEGPTC